ncbi:unnamed protein product [Clavelina lepadiformis]|uniref:K Homology domain-containing protein n=1 Tax=Clavelina lepadiformis TaxID=159417 RepID=A0ABP0H3L5_CLALP
MADEHDNSSGGNVKRPHDDPIDGGNAKRSRGSDKIEMRLLIPSNTAGAVIGKGGSNIKDLRHEFNANVQLPDSQGIERIISATTKTISDAAKLAGRVMESLCERLQRRDKEGIIKLLVHKSQAGTIIGLKGSRIKELRETTGANIKVNQECCPNSTDRICQIKGQNSTVVKSLNAILELLQDAPPKGPIHNYDPNYWDDSYDYGGYNKFDRDGPPMDRGGRRGGFNQGVRGSGGRRYGNQDNLSGGGYSAGGRDQAGFGGGRNSRYGASGGRGAYGGYDEDGYDDYEDDYGDYTQGYADDVGAAEYGLGSQGEEITKQVTIPNEYAGSIIGKGGTRIMQIRQDSGAMIKIDEAEPGSNERIITITGTKEQTQNAQYLLQKSVKMFSGEY